LADDLLKISSSGTSTNKSESSKLSQYHWLIYPQEPTPNYIVEAKKRLGQIKQPNVAPNQKSSSSSNKASSVEEKDAKQVVNEASESVKETNIKRSPSNSALINKHWINWEKPETPEKIKQIRKRLGDDRYRHIDRSKTFSQLEIRPKLENFSLVDSNTNKAEENSTVTVTNTIVLNENESESAISNSVNNSEINTNEPYKIPEANLEITNKVVVSYPPPVNPSPQSEVYGILPVEETVLTNVTGGKFSSNEKSKYSNDVSSSSQVNESSEIKTNDETGLRRSKSSRLFNNNYTINTENNNANGSLTLESWMQSANEQGMYG
jgi:hypothetical protein